MNVDILTLGPFAANCYILWNESRNAIVIDPGYDAESIDTLLTRRELIVDSYFLTHGHMDHVSGLAGLLNIRPAPVAMHPADFSWAFTDANGWEPYYPIPTGPEKLDIEFCDEQQLMRLDTELIIYESPGHSPGGVLMFFPEHGYLVTGDTLFAGSIGRTDLPRSNPTDMERSLARFKTFPANTRVLPGHGPETTIEHELQSNPFLS